MLIISRFLTSEFTTYLSTSSLYLQKRHGRHIRTILRHLSIATSGVPPAHAFSLRLFPGVNKIVIYPEYTQGPYLIIKAVKWRHIGTLKHKIKQHQTTDSFVY
jgi:hypothetical protein